MIIVGIRFILLRSKEFIIIVFVEYYFLCLWVMLFNINVATEASQCFFFVC